PAAHDPADGDAAARVVAGGRPDGTVPAGVELPGDDARSQAGVRGQHLVRGDHREAVTEDDDDRVLHAGQRRREHDVVGDGDRVAGEVAVPVDAEQVAGVGRVLVDAGGLGMVDAGRI